MNKEVPERNYIWDEEINRNRKNVFYTLGIHVVET